MVCGSTQKKGQKAPNLKRDTTPKRSPATGTQSTQPQKPSHGGPTKSPSKAKSVKKNANPSTSKKGSNLLIKKDGLPEIGISDRKRAGRAENERKKGKTDGGKGSISSKKMILCSKFGIFFVVLCHLAFLIYIFLANIINDSIPVSTGLILTITHVMVMFLSMEVIFYAKKSLCLFTMLVDVLTILATFIFITTNETSNTYYGHDEVESKKLLRNTIIANAESCFILVLNLCMMVALYTEIRVTSRTEIGVTVMSVDVEKADEAREDEKDKSKEGVGRLANYIPFLKMVPSEAPTGKPDVQRQSLGGRVNPPEGQGMLTMSAPKAPQPQTKEEPIRSAVKSSQSVAPTSVAAPPRSVPINKTPAKSTQKQDGQPGSAAVAPLPSAGSTRVDQQRTSSPKSILSATFTKKMPEKTPATTAVATTVQPQTGVQTTTTSGDRSGSIQTAVVNETVTAANAVPQQTIAAPEKTDATVKAIPSTPVTKRVSTAKPVEPNEKVTPLNTQPSPTPMRYLYEDKYPNNH